MAQNGDAVYKLLKTNCCEAYTPTHKKEYAEVQALARNKKETLQLHCHGTGASYFQKLKDRKFSY